jgi:HEAT repeat protein
MFLNSGGRPVSETALLRSEVQNLQQTLAVSLMEQPSAFDRLKGINISANMRQPNEQLLAQLLRTLNSDSNINVRLAAIDALYLFHNHPLVKEGLVHSLSNQTDPMVQVALINLMVSLKEQKAITALRTLIQNEELEPEVKNKAQDGIHKLSF